MFKRIKHIIQRQKKHERIIRLQRTYLDKQFAKVMPFTMPYKKRCHFCKTMGYECEDYVKYNSTTRLTDLGAPMSIPCLEKFDEKYFKITDPILTHHSLSRITYGLYDNKYFGDQLASELKLLFGVGATSDFLCDYKECAFISKPALINSCVRAILNLWDSASDLYHQANIMVISTLPPKNPCQYKNMGIVEANSVQDLKVKAALTGGTCLYGVHQAVTPVSPFDGNLVNSYYIGTAFAKIKSKEDKYDRKS